MRGRYRKAGWHTKRCRGCGKLMVFRYYCHAKSRVFCSRACHNLTKGLRPVRNQFGVIMPWTAEEDDYLRRCYPNCSQPKRLAVKLGRSVVAVNKRAKQLNLTRTRQAVSRGYALGGKMNKGRPRPDFAANAFVGVGRDNPFYGKKHTPETRRILSAKARALGTFRQLAKDPEFQRRRMLGLHARPNKPESVVRSMLNKMFPGEYRYSGDGSFIVDGLNPDFVNINGQKKVIEVFGEQYHDPNHAVRAISHRSTEAGRKKVFARFGYKMLVVWSKEIYGGGATGRRVLRQKIREFHEDLCN